MTEIDAKYSVLLFYGTLPDDFEQIIYEHIIRGVKVYLFTMDSLEDYETNEMWVKQNKNGLFEWHEVIYDTYIVNEQEAFIDGEITHTSLFDFLIKNAKLFNVGQYRAIHAKPDVHMMLRAGAGTGKTTTIIHRLLFLKHIDTNFEFTKAFLITFTNEAAATMLERLYQTVMMYFDVTHDKKYLDWLEEVGKTNISTIHSFASQIIKPIAIIMGYQRDIQIRSYKYRRNRLIEHWIDQFSKEFPDTYQSNFKYTPYYYLKNIFERLFVSIRNQSIHPDEMNKIDFGENPNSHNQLLKYLLVNVSRELENEKKNDGSVEVEDLISNLKVFTYSGDLRVHLPDIQYLVVDEFQDTDVEQVKFIAWLVKHLQSKVMVVGDIKQSIYRFRGADYTAFDQLSKSMESEVIHEYYLTMNYRTTHLLLQKFEAKFTAWKSRVVNFPYTQKDKLTSVRADYSEGYVDVPMNDANLRLILTRLEKEQDSAVLVRTNSDVDKMIKRIEEMGFFCEGDVKSDFFRNIAVREFYILIKWLIQPNVVQNHDALHRSSYGAKTFTIKDVFSNYSRRSNDTLSHLQNQSDYEDFEKLYHDIRVNPILYPISNFLQKKDPANTYRRRLYKKMRISHPERDPELQKVEALLRYKEYRMNLEHLLMIIKRTFSDIDLSIEKLEQFLKIKMAVDSVEQSRKIEEAPHRIKVKTVHKAKGQEFNNVFIPITDHTFIKYSQPIFLLDKKGDEWRLGYRIKLNDSVIKNDYFYDMMPDEKNEIIGEETRLLYVALTRAKNNCFVNSNWLSSTSTRIDNWQNLLDLGGTEYVSS